MKYYIDINGKDGAKGTEQEPLKRLNIIPNRGDEVLFKSDQVHFGKVRAVSGVKYSSYGEGYKPIISLGLEAIKEWKLDNGLWVYDLGYFNDFEIEDIGNIFIDSVYGFKRWTKEDCKGHGCFYFDSDKVYLSSIVNPNYHNIKLCITKDIIHYTDCDNVVIENIDLRYGGAHGINAWGDERDIKISNCDFSYIGGGKLYNQVRYGNAVQNWGNIDGLIISNCSAHEIYDTAFTHQYKGNENIIQKNILIQSNESLNCNWGYEYYNRTNGETSNVEILNNIFKFCGYGWSYAQRNDKDSCSIRLAGTPNNTKDFVIRDNVIDISKDYLLMTLFDNQDKYTIDYNIYSDGKFRHHNGDFASFEDYQNKFGYDLNSIYGYIEEENTIEKLKQEFKEAYPELYFASDGEKLEKVFEFFKNKL